MRCNCGGRLYFLEVVRTAKHYEIDEQGNVDSVAVLVEELNGVLDYRARCGWCNTEYNIDKIGDDYDNISIISIEHQFNAGGGKSNEQEKEN